VKLAIEYLSIYKVLEKTCYKVNGLIFSLFICVYFLVYIFPKGVFANRKQASYYW